MVKDFKTSSLTNVAAANVCTKKKTKGLYHIPERRYFNFSPGRFFGNCGYTYRAGCMILNRLWLHAKFNINIKYVYKTVLLFLITSLIGVSKRRFLFLFKTVETLHKEQNTEDVTKT